MIRFQLFLFNCKADVVAYWEKFLIKGRNHVDKDGLPIIDDLINRVEALETHFNDADFHQTIAIIHDVTRRLHKLLPHITNTKFHQLNDEIVREAEELINAKLTNTATPEHLQAIVKKSMENYTADF